MKNIKKQILSENKKEIGILLIPLFLALIYLNITNSPLSYFFILIVVITILGFVTAIFYLLKKQFDIFDELLMEHKKILEETK